jgi:hypothetical protein
MATISNSDSPLLCVFFLLDGGKFRLRERVDGSAEVLDDEGEPIGHAYQRGGGWSVWTKPFAGHVPHDQIEWVE